MSKFKVGDVVRYIGYGKRIAGDKYIAYGDTVMVASIYHDIYRCITEDGYRILAREYNLTSTDTEEDNLLSTLKRLTSYIRERSSTNEDPIKNVIYDGPATIVFWADGTKTVVKCDGEEYDPEKGLAMAMVKKALGNKGNYYNIFKKWVPTSEKTNYKGTVRRLLDESEMLRAAFIAIDAAKKVGLSIVYVDGTVYVQQMLNTAGYNVEIEDKTGILCADADERVYTLSVILYSKNKEENNVETV